MIVSGTDSAPRSACRVDADHLSNAWPCIEQTGTGAPCDTLERTMKDSGRWFARFLDGKEGV